VGRGRAEDRNGTFSSHNKLALARRAGTCVRELRTSLTRGHTLRNSPSQLSRVSGDSGANQFGYTSARLGVLAQSELHVPRILH
jgi:hypothetical protein